MTESNTVIKAARKIEVWEAPEWVSDAIFYQIFPERFANGDPANDPAGVEPWGGVPTGDNFFGGDLEGILQRLSYLEQLGVTAIYLTPIFKARTNHKYDTVDYLTIDPAFGDEKLLKKVVAEAHRRGIRVILDAVFNHCGDHFGAFEDVRALGSASPYTDWFFVESFPVTAKPPNYQTCGGTHYLPKLNVAHPDVCEYLMQVATYWIESCDIDGWRLDVPWKAPMGFWRTFRERVKEVKSDAYIVAEVWRDARPWLAGDTCDGVMNYSLRNHVLDYCAYDHMDAEDFNYELRALLQMFGAAAPYQLNLLGSHDTPRLLTLCNENVERAILAVTFLLTFTGAPMIYYGDEVGMIGGDDPDCRRTMIWDPERWNGRLHEQVRELIKLRRRSPALRRGAFETLTVFNAVYAYRRYLGDEEIIVVLNPREERAHVTVPLTKGSLNRKWRDFISGQQYFVDGSELKINRLPAQSALVLCAA